MKKVLGYADEKVIGHLSDQNVFIPISTELIEELVYKYRDVTAYRPIHIEVDTDSELEPGIYQSCFTFNTKPTLKTIYYGD